MNKILLEILVVAILLIVNAIFAMTEMALVSSSKARLRARAKKGERGAHTAIELAKSPNRFLSTVQIGITLIGILAGAFGGATLAAEIGAILHQVPYIGAYGNQIALALIVLVITYFSLVVGELVPKRLALRHPEDISIFMARPMQVLSRIASPVVNILSTSTEILLRLMRIREETDSSVTEEEVAGMVNEGLEAGVLHQTESEMVHRVLALDRLNVRQIMTPRPRIVWVGVNEVHEELWHKIVVTHHSHFPVYDGKPDHAIGFLSVKSIYANLAANVPVQVRDLITPVLIVSEIQSAIDLLETFKQKGRHIALATNEYGDISGLVTINDVMEAIVGELPEEGEQRTAVFVQREDGSTLVDALVGIEEMKVRFPMFNLDEEEERKYSTVGGFVCERLGHIPTEGEKFEYNSLQFEVMDMDRQRVDKVLVTQLFVNESEA
ncbi:MAG: hemolysin family protein [Chthoniobacterales bacterium]